MADNDIPREDTYSKAVRRAISEAAATPGARRAHVAESDARRSNVLDGRPKVSLRRNFERKTHAAFAILVAHFHGMGVHEQELAWATFQLTSFLKTAERDIEQWLQDDSEDASRG